MKVSSCKRTIFWKLFSFVLCIRTPIDQKCEKVPFVPKNLDSQDFYAFMRTGSMFCCKVSIIKFLLVMKLNISDNFILVTALDFSNWLPNVLLILIYLNFSMSIFSSATRLISPIKASIETFHLLTLYLNENCYFWSLHRNPKSATIPKSTFDFDLHLFSNPNDRVTKSLICFIKVLIESFTFLRDY